MRIVPLNMSAVWGNEIVLQLIELYQNHGLLWDTSNRDYKNKIKKNNAWEDIANALKLPRKEVEAKVHTLRSQFLREKKKISCSKTTGSGRDDVKSSLWFAYDSMKFLLRGATTSGSIDTLETQTQRQDSNDQFPESPNTESTQEAVPSQPSHESMETPTSSKTSRKRTIPREEKLEEAFEVMRSAKIKMLNSTQDEFAVYGQYVGSELRQVKDEHSVLMAKHYINNILIDARMGKYRRGYSTASSSIHSLDPTDSTDCSMSPEQLDAQISEIMSNIDSPDLSQ